MLAEERFSLILDLLARQRTATVQELCEALNASESTIRRDLNELDKQGKLNKVHGGATLPDSPFRTDEPTMAAKEELAVSQKQSIAQAAAELILPEDFIYLDAGSSTLALARALSGPALNASYVTNGVAHARLLAQKFGQIGLGGNKVELFFLFLDQFTVEPRGVGNVAHQPVQSAHVMVNHIEKLFAMLFLLDHPQ